MITMVSTRKIDFADWLNDKIDKAGWSYREFSRRGGLSSGAVSKVINRQSFPGPDFCNGVSRALNIPAERVFRKAGLLPARIIGDDESSDKKEQLLDYFDALSKDDQSTIIAVTKALYEQRASYIVQSDKEG